MKLSTRGQKWLKVVHLVCAIAWIGSAIVMNALRHLVATDNAEAMYYVAVVLEAVDMQILVPGAVACLLTGVAYGLLTGWGFFKHRWIVVKWILTVFMILFGTFYMGPRVKDNVVVGEQLMEGSGEAAAYWSNVTDCAWSGGLQIVLLTLIVIISVFKPWKKSRARGTC